MRLSVVQAAKGKVDTALTTVGRTFTWSQYPTVAANNLVTKEQILELRSAADHAHNGVVASTTAHTGNCSNKSDRTDYSYNSNVSYNSSTNSDNSSNNAVCNNDSYYFNLTPSG